MGIASSLNPSLELVSVGTSLGLGLDVAKSGEITSVSFGSLLLPHVTMYCDYDRSRC